ncbi:MAG: class I mannose-6-phosphate isomerase [Synergistaceae bacterium]|jgi:mannose-6-phosphate isomerase|nr:class I mannose-6-phosphate isomerase [Synergistaceae bacterium]
MFVLQPIFHKTIWGGGKLISVYGEDARGVAHLYSLRCKDENSNIILNGKFAGRRLYEVIGPYPLSIALVDAAENLSVQVHPGGESAKYESYFFIDAPVSGSVYCGTDGMPREEIRRLAESGALLSHIKRLAVKDGDYVFIEPRTVHALTAGSFVYEIEEGNDCTYRLFDYNRTDADGKVRELQTERAAEVLDPSKEAVVRGYRPNTPVTEKTYETRLLTDISAFHNHEPNDECLTLLSGDAVIDGIQLKTGMSVLMEPGESVENVSIGRCIVARALMNGA